MGTSAGHQLPVQQLSGSIRGTVVDPSGSAVGAARINLTQEDESPSQEAWSADDGQFSFADIAPGPFHLTIIAEGFATQVVSGILQPGEAHISPAIALSLATKTTEVRVELPPVELAEEQVKQQEKQRVLGFIPNFYTSYVPNPAPLNPKQKFNLALRTAVDPVTFAISGAIAGVQQAQNKYSAYGQGAQGYGKRFGASYADLATGTIIGGAILPSLLKQDPRYFYKGSGRIGSRFLYATANSFICKGDNGRWQANYSNIFGSIAAGGISTLYYHSNDRSALKLTFESAVVRIGATVAANLLQEFVFRKLTPKKHNLQITEP